MTTFDDNAQRVLLEERGNLVDRLKELGATESGALRNDLDFGDGFADAAAATAERTELIGLVESLRGMLEDVDAALAKIRAGTYGTCDRCGRKIDAARLEARPASRLCLDCKSKSSP
ncbi:MAG: TraR/DksA family transcriptional regulator [Acidimicrobiia bacterium]